MKNYQALSERGDLKVVQRRLDEAAADFEKALKINSHYGPALRGAGFCSSSRTNLWRPLNSLKNRYWKILECQYHLLLGIANLELIAARLREKLYRRP